MAWTPEQKRDALQALRDGDTLAAVHHRTGIPKSTIRDWAERTGISTTARASEKTREATAANVERWAELRSALADRSGNAASLLLEMVTDALRSGELEVTSLRDAKDAATAMGILVDKAQLLTGGVTSRHETADAAKSKAAEVFDEVAARRKAHAA